VVGLLLYYFYTLYKESYTSEYVYEIRIGTDSVFYNVTVYVPFPVSEKEIDEAIFGLFKNTEKSLGYKVNFDFNIYSIVFNLVELCFYSIQDYFRILFL